MNNDKESVNAEWNNSWDNFEKAKDALEEAVLEYEETIFEYGDSPNLYNEMANGMDKIWGFLFSHHQESLQPNGIHEKPDFESVSDEMFGISIKWINNKYQVFLNVSGHDINLADEAALQAVLNVLFGPGEEELTTNVMAFGKSIVEYIESSDKRYESLNPRPTDVSPLLEYINVGSTNDITMGYHSYKENALAEHYDFFSIK